MPRHIGSLKFWNDDKGYGFIASDDLGGGDFFVGRRAMEEAELTPIKGCKLTFEVGEDRQRRSFATALRLHGAAEDAECIPSRTGAAVSEEAVTDLRERLVAMRDSLVGQLVERIDGGALALLGSVGMALAALDAMQAQPGDPGRQ
jgi:CspA family cold shock protein